MKQRLVVLGTGFGSYSLIKNLRRKLYNITVVSPRNHFLFTPLLPSTAVGTIEFRSIIEPIRNLAAALNYIRAAATNIDFSQNTVLCSGCFWTGLLMEYLGGISATFNLIKFTCGDILRRDK